MTIMKILMTSLFTILSTIIISIPAAYAITGFEGPYDPSNWTFNANGGDGFVDTSNAPDKIMITGNDNLQPSIQTDYTISIQCDGVVVFDWTYDGEPVADDTGPSFDPSGFLLNGAQNQLTDNAGAEIQSGTGESVLVSAGDVFGWYVFSNDGGEGPGIFTMIENFEGPSCLIGGNMLSINTTTLRLAGAQTFSRMIPVLLSGIGIGLFVFRKSEES